MRLVLRFSMLVIIAGLAWSQALTDAAGVIAGSSVGVGAGKKVGQGIASALNAANGTTVKVAKAEPKTEKVASVEKPPAAKPTQRAGDGGGSGGSGSGSNGGTVLKTGPGGVVKDHSLVPPPPVKKVAVVPPPPPLAPPAPVLMIAPILVLPPPPQVTPEDLKTLASGTSREEVLKLGAPSSRITMIGDDGHLVEVFRYQTRETTFGIVRLSDGSVSSVQVH
jgi:hypothetical protein